MTEEISTLKTTVLQTETDKAKLHKLYNSLLQRQKQTPESNQKTLLHHINIVKTNILTTFHQDMKEAHHLNHHLNPDTDYADFPLFSYNGLRDVIEWYSAPPFAPD